MPSRQTMLKNKGMAGLWRPSLAGARRKFLGIPGDSWDGDSWESLEYLGISGSSCLKLLTEVTAASATQKV
jgi:hypothetical protein